MIDAQLMHAINTDHYLTFNRKDNNTRRLLTMLAREHQTTGHADEGFTTLSMCDIPGQLAKSWDRAMRVAIAGDMADTLPTGWSGIRRVKRWWAVFAAMPRSSKSRLMQPTTFRASK